MGLVCAEDPLHYGEALQVKESLKNGQFSDTQHTHPGIFILEWPPSPIPGSKSLTGFPSLFHSPSTPELIESLSPKH